MELKQIASFDVYYYADYAKACCVVFKLKPEGVIAEYCTYVEPVKKYIPGEFFLAGITLFTQGV